MPVYDGEKWVKEQQYCYECKTMQTEGDIIPWMVAECSDDGYESRLHWRSEKVFVCKECQQKKQEKDERYKHKRIVRELNKLASGELGFRKNNE